MNKGVILAAICLIVAAAIMLLQMYLSKRTGKWPGLVIPILFFLASFISPLNMAVPAGGIGIGTIIQLIVLWITGNVPTFIMLGIYFICRKEQKKDTTA